jgi:hypothetical protein
MRKAISITILLIIVIVAGYIYWFYYNPYGDGSREGVLQKFARKGNVFKTYEGEMIQLGYGQRSNAAVVNSNYFNFSVTDRSIADSLDHCLGKAVRLHYTQYRRSLPWRGDNYADKNAGASQYIVDKIEEVKDSNAY